MILESYGGSKMMTIVATSAKVQAFALLALVALDIKVDQPTATIVVALLVAISSMWQSWTLTKVHTLVNSNFTEAKAARLAAEAALKTQQDLNVELRQQLALKNNTAPPVPPPVQPLT